MSKYRITGRTNSWIAQRDSTFNGRCEITIADQLGLKDAYKKLLNMYNDDNSDYPSAPNWGIAVRQGRGAQATFLDGTRCYEYDSRYYQIEELPYKMTDLLKEEVQECADVELYCYTGKIHSIHTDNIMSLDEELNFKELYCSGIEELDYKVMDEDEYNNTVLANACENADFEELYGNKNSKVLVVVLNNYNV
jgi:hypothetical protein